VFGFIELEGATAMRNRFSNLASAALASAALMAFAPGAMAYPMYTLGATDLSDGGTISGNIFFDVYGFIDDSSPGFTVSTGAPIYSDVTFSNANASLGTTIWDFFVSGTYSPMLQLAFSGDPLTGPATLLTGIGGQSFICGAAGSYLCGGSTARDYLTTGSLNEVANEVTNTPLPSTWTMLIAGFVGLIGFVAFGGKKRNTAAFAAA
jgi:hypothetical protein